MMGAEVCITGILSRNNTKPSVFTSKNISIIIKSTNSANIYTSLFNT